MMNGEHLFIAAFAGHAPVTNWQTLHTVACAIGDRSRQGLWFSHSPNPYSFIGSEADENRRHLAAYAANVRMGSMALYESNAKCDGFADTGEQRARINEAYSFGNLGRLFVRAAEGIFSRHLEAGRRRHVVDVYPETVEALTALEDHIVAAYGKSPPLSRLHVPVEIMVDVAVDHIGPGFPARLPPRQREALCNLAALGRRHF